MKDSWVWSEDFKCYILGDAIWYPPREFKLNEKHLAWEPGKSSHNACLRGSTKDNFHGWDFGYDMKAAIEWLHEPLA